MATILVIDDHPDTLLVMLKIVERLGHRALGAATGEAGMAVVHSDRPDVIIVDGMMPGMNGTEFIRLCRASPETATLPIILNTAVDDQNFIDDAVKKGASEVWLKGQVQIAQIQERLAHQLKGIGDEPVS